MKAIFYDIAAVIAFHIVIVLALSGLAVFVWNCGMVVMLPSAFSPLSYVTALAIMTGIYIINMALKNYTNRIIAYRHEKNIEKILIQRDKKNQ